MIWKRLIFLLQLSFGYRTYSSPRYRYIRWVERPQTTEKSPIYRRNIRPTYRYPSNYYPHQHRSRDLSYSSYARKAEVPKPDVIKVEARDLQDISEQISAAVRTNACPSDVPIDILFLLDSSYMTTSTAYSQFKRLVAYMASTMMYSDSMVKMAVFQFDETQTERFISFHDYDEFSGFKTSLSEMKRKALGRKGRHASRRSQRHLRSLRRRFGRNSSKMEGDPFEGALDNVQKYGFSRSRGARAQAVKILIVMSGETPTYSSNALATKLRSFHDVNIFAVVVGEEDSGITDEFTGSASRILRVIKENRLVDELAQLQQLICRDFETCNTSSFQCLKKYNTGGYASSYITKCHRVNCEHGKCLTKPCHPTQFCKEKGSYDFECSNSSLEAQLTCEDLSCGNGVYVDECALEPCEYGYECINTAGSYECVDIDECAQAHCPDGFTCKNFKGDFKCYDINECDDNPCDENESCENTVGGFLCSFIDPCAKEPCEVGFECRVNEAGFECVDINECEKENICPSGYRCENFNGDYECIDIDECAHEIMACPVGYKCENSDGDFKCSFVDHCEENPCAAGLECSNTIDGSFKCSDIDECLNEPCDKGEECINLHGGYRCEDVDECKRECLSLSVVVIHPCESGFKCANLPGAYECIDIDECAEEINTCSKRQTCQNTEGSFECIEIDLCENAQCEAGYECVDYVDGFECLDINECVIDSPCDLGFTCKNTPGSYQCEDFDECAVFGEANICEIGFKCVNNVGNFSCVDVDECLEIGSCPVGFECYNKHGSYDCLDINECFEEPCDNGYACLNNEGSYTCVDVNECTAESCQAGTNCVNTLGSYECKDIDECENSPCEEGFYCSNSFGSFSCLDVDECATLSSPCDDFSNCVNTPGSFVCEEIQEEEKDEEEADSTSEALSTCDGANHKCSHTCILLSTSTIIVAPSTPIHIAAPNVYYRCDCPNGYELAQDGHTCLDIDECQIRKGGCSDYCFNTQGGYRCVCGEGEDLSSDMHTCVSKSRKNKNSGCKVECENGLCIDDVCKCSEGWKGNKCDQDIDECIQSPCNHGRCINTEGSFMCQCDKGFQFDYQIDNCVDVNECLSPKRNLCEQDCINKEGTYSCKCREDFVLSADGHSCVPLGICAENPCYNNGKCVIDKHSFHCECEKGFTGRLCHQQVQFELPDFLNIESESIRSEITACEDECRNGGKCMESSPNQHQCQCTDRYYGRSCEKLRSVPNVCKDQAFDIVFLIDGSIRIGRKNYNMVIDWIKSIVTQLNISQERSRIGLVQFSTKTEIEFDLARFNDKSNLLQGLEQSKNRFKNMGYNAYAGLRNSIDLFHGKNPRFLIMITAGRLYIHPRRLKEVLNAAEHSKVEVFAVKLGKMTNEAELMGLTKNDRSIFGIRHKSDFRKEGAAILTSICFKDDWRNKIIEED
ncbi:Oidioi.mRNA.OKI2018_I69.XSR.g13575.t1.cds [Oikopleura dioica]|uniref:Oidioi.mRNA.OKI2018_I69.XSR.g13575.t1.cds n=1 Tax=Oikopleura dioica TaxID=34765 RepID=A0ABN7SB01_OIKDI|nr:Oidioi.mRNA.OKI2018_I69.XSR.g13575.t1.cds [Oikopleura dioica]